MGRRCEYAIVRALESQQAQWNILTHYQRFESAVAFVLTVVIALIVLVALYRLCVGVVTALLFGAVDISILCRLFQH